MSVTVIRRLRKHGVSAHIKGFGRTLYRVAKRHRVPLALLLTIGERESSFQNEFGHDPVHGGQIVGGPVTEVRYKVYKAHRRQGDGNQGVGPFQLTSPGFQDLADAHGGCWRPDVNADVAAGVLANLVHAYGLHDGVRRYNGSGPAAEAYAKSVVARMSHWDAVIHGRA